jgi:hypothetical protein
MKFLGGDESAKPAEALRGEVRSEQTDELCPMLGAGDVLS